jgi:hypothetical protein
MVEPNQKICALGVMEKARRVWRRGSAYSHAYRKKEAGMPWHKVVIRNTEKARWSAATRMRPFIMGYHEHGSTPPANAVVYYGLTETRDHVYYFSPEASAIANATKAFQTFDVTQCPEPPHLDGLQKVTIS